MGGVVPYDQVVLLLCGSSDGCISTPSACLVFVIEVYCVYILSLTDKRQMNTLILHSHGIKQMRHSEPIRTQPIAIVHWYHNK